MNALRIRCAKIGGHRGTDGFTLIELLVVVGIIALLAGLLFPSLVTAKKAARSVRCQGNLRQMGIGLAMYLDDHARYPGGEMNLPFHKGHSGHFYQGLNPYLSPPFSHHWVDGSYEFVMSDLYQCTEGQISRVWGWNLGDNDTRFVIGGSSSRTGRRSVGEKEMEDFKERYDFVTNFVTRPYLGYNSSGSTPDGAYGLAHVQGSRIAVPSEMITMGCQTLSQSALPYYGRSIKYFRHNNRANYLYADGHVERGDWVHRTSDGGEIRRQWNVDHEPHFDGL